MEELTPNQVGAGINKYNEVQQKEYRTSYGETNELPEG